MSSTPDLPTGQDAASLLTEGIGRRGLLRAAGVLAAAGVVESTGALSPASAAGLTATGGKVGPVRTLQPGVGRTAGTYVQSLPDQVYWGKLPNRLSKPVAVVRSGDLVSVDTISHEGILEDQGKDPLGYFRGFDVPVNQVLSDAVAVAAKSKHDGPGPHVVTGPIAVRGAEP